jgi:CelD/BcsL family acetyltransferase involved in cellulose biosynthesis
MKPLDVEVARPSQLGARERETWRAMQAANPALAGPYFSLGFLDAVERARADTRVAVIREGGAVTGFLPFQRGMMGHARPLGGPLGDHHGFICEPGRAFDLPPVLKGAGIGVLDFHGGLATQRTFAEHAFEIDGSWVIDLSRGYDAFIEQRSAIQPKAFRNLRARRRKLEEMPEGFEFRVNDTRPEALKTVLGWKSAQYVRTGHFDVFSVRWTQDLVKALMESERDGCRGIVSSLEIGGKLVAGHFGMQSNDVLHYWFPAYDPDYAQIGPGLALLTEICRELSEDGVREVHLGPGEYDFKAHLAAWQFPLAQGHAETPSVFAAARGVAVGSAKAVEKLPLGPLRTIPRRALRRIDRMAGFHAA